jgi:DNA polymerase zeta
MAVQLYTGGLVVLEKIQKLYIIHSASDAGGRWRCLQYWVRRARLTLAMMEQLDMTGRTGELARAFGIDFFSVLTRGSQYRVEAMMVRLAHTQNYLLPAPSKAQVSSDYFELHETCFLK